MITRNNLLTMAGILVAILIITAQIAKCSREKPAAKHHANRVKLANADSLQSILDTRHRAELSKVKQAYQDTLRDMKKKYSSMAKKDVQLESRYRKAPAAVGCDSVIGSKNSRIAALESMAQHQEQVNQANDSMLTSYAGSIRAKEKTIGALNAGYAKATQDLQQDLKPKRWGVGVIGGGGIGPALKPEPFIGVGLSYNFIRL